MAGSISSDLISKLNKEAQNSTTKKKDDKSIGQNEFLQMLVTQLKNQDPMNPMNGDEFAVNLAQFSSLERLVSIDNKMGSSSSAGDSASLASYLGHDVVLNTQKITVEGNDGGMLRVDLPTDASNVEVDLIDSKGEKAKTLSLGAATQGKQRIKLDNLDLPNGEYTFEIRALNATGSKTSILGQVGGLVDGFVPGADPKLLIGGREVSPNDVKAVLAPISAA